MGVYDKLIALLSKYHIHIEGHIQFKRKQPVYNESCEIYTPVKETHSKYSENILLDFDEFCILSDKKCKFA